MAASKNLTPEQRSQRARLAARASWGNTEDRARRTAPARQASAQARKADPTEQRAKQLERRIREVVDAAPPLSDAQRARLAAILVPGGDNR